MFSREFPKNAQNMSIFRVKIADNLHLRMFLVVFFMSKVGTNVAVDGYDIYFAIAQIFH